MRAMRMRHWLYSAPRSTSRNTVNKPSTNVPGRTVATNGKNAHCDCEPKPIATSALDSEKA